MKTTTLVPFAYQPGGSPLHRLPVGPKLICLTLLTLFVAFVDSPVVDAAGVAGALGLHMVARLPPAVLRRSLVPVLWIVVPVVIYLGAIGQWRTGLSNAADVLTTVVAAAAVSATTSPAAFLDTVEAAMAQLAALPLLGNVVRRLVDADRVALTLSLTLAAIPAVARCVDDARVAAAARGLERNLRARVTPAAIRSIGHAFRVADALTARGLGD